MAGTLVIDTLNASSGPLSTNNGMSGIAKAWVNFAGSTGSINSSMNVSSVTRNATGNYTVTFTNAMPNANYVVCHAATNQGTNSGNWTTSGTPVIQTYLASTKSTSSVNILNMYAGGSNAFDNVEQGIAIHA